MIKDQEKEGKLSICAYIILYVSVNEDMYELMRILIMPDYPRTHSVIHAGLKLKVILLP